MKILQKRVKVVYRFRCVSCRTKFEMDEQEAEETGAHIGYRGSFEFNCPICKRDNFSVGRETTKISIMDDGTEVEW